MKAKNVNVLGLDHKDQIEAVFDHFDTAKQAKEFIREKREDPHYWDQRAEVEGWHKQIASLGLEVDGHLISTASTKWAQAAKQEREAARRAKLCPHDPAKDRHYDGRLGYEAYVCPSCGVFGDHYGVHEAENWSLRFAGLPEREQTILQFEHKEQLSFRWWRDKREDGDDISPAHVQELVTRALDYIPTRRKLGNEKGPLSATIRLAGDPEEVDYTGYWEVE